METALTKQPQLICLLADHSCADLYRAEMLDVQDKNRVAHNPSLAQRMDWKVSRYLKQQAVLPVLSLSHSKGSAAVLTGNGVPHAGVDLEYMRPRDFAALAEWVAAPHEQEYLAQRGWLSEDFYELWTLKEALLKAAGLAFPSDMQRVGWQYDSDGLKCLHVNQEGGWNGISAKIGNFMLACVWKGQAECTLEAPRDMEVHIIKRWHVCSGNG
ncbi:4'-phosphopantetheinyl transferase superfamily protein [Neisseria sp. Dent CA1/247]|uniref:4'-phosphopantetheinyl transferase family protein n=1 Tax=Neisseria sp. Dent CA1/247 TaxID=2912675 RepID=UPI001FD2D172|nr:4'-phosphopantetheinyl transferase superfamily protein [Neisseria sp. Dent CA1/247]UOO76163.1 4'-phosphopantetheinyl transferase superfamily protein [Neisseria sp. Dent CA1/247]